MAQLLAYSIIPRVLELSAAELEQNSLESVDAGKRRMLQSIWDFLDQNADAIKLRVKQQLFFTEYRLEEKLTVKGLMEISSDAVGEIVPVHILTMLMEVMKEKPASGDDRFAGSAFATVSPKSSLSSNSGTVDVDKDSESLLATLQTKRIPLDSLRLQTNDETVGLRNPHRPNAMLGHTRQRVIVCASLLSKATNIAGIARTCEVRVLLQRGTSRTTPLSALTAFVS